MNIKLRKNKNLLIKQTITENGITLIALVVTIVVLLILAGVTITMVLGEDGIIAQAKLAAEKTKEAEEQAKGDLANLTEEISNILTSEPPTPTKPTPSPTPKPLSSLAQAAQDGTKFDKNTKLEDEYGNLVTIPAGFKIVPHGTDNVEYKYSTENPGTPTVQDGIVIEDVSAGDDVSKGNQFVWIPVGNIKNKDGQTTTITLGRYENDKYTGNVGDAKDGNDVINSYYQELTTGKGNTTAKSITDFKESVNGKDGKAGNGGYYLARYEASYGGTNKPLSKPSTGTPSTREGTNYAPSTDNQKGQLWNNITQPNAAQAAQAMYPTNENYTSDLTNSYAWDTAIVFIQKYSGDEDYSKEKGATFSSTLRNTGAGEGDKADKRCNIYDMAGNCREWTTETSTEFDDYYDSYYPCVYRGGVHNLSNEFTASRGITGTSSAISDISFRPILYVALKAD